MVIVARKRENSQGLNSRILQELCVRSLPDGTNLYRDWGDVQYHEVEREVIEKRFITRVPVGEKRFTFRTRRTNRFTEHVESPAIREIPQRDWPNLVPAHYHELQWTLGVPAPDGKEYWECYRADWEGHDLPFGLNPSHRVSWTEDAVWGSFDDAVTAYNLCWTPGKVLIPRVDSTTVILDFDTARNKETGEPYPWAVPFLRDLVRARVPIFTSKSGGGYHALVVGNWPSSAKNRVHKLKPEWVGELWTTPPKDKEPGIDALRGRWDSNKNRLVSAITHLTGNPVVFDFQDLEGPWNRQAALDAVWRRLVEWSPSARKEAEGDSTVTVAPRESIEFDADDQQKLEIGRAFAKTFTHAVDGSGGSKPAMALACRLNWGLALDKGDEELFLHCVAEWNVECSPPWEDWQLLHKFADARKATEADNLKHQKRERGWLLHDWKMKTDAEPKRPRIVFGAELDRRYPDLKPPVIHGMLRVGEVANLIAPPKAGKSYLGLGLAFAIANNLDWIGTRPVNPDAGEPNKGLALYVDNELDPETYTHRQRRMVNRTVRQREGEGHEAYLERKEQMKDRVGALHLVLEEYWDNLPNLETLLREECQPGRFRIIILDALYRMIPEDENENDNGRAMARYKRLKRLAVDLDVAIVLVHHTSKGDQSRKAITDVGAGAGAQSRAADAHIVLRPHKEEEKLVLDAVVRSWDDPFKPVVLRRDCGVWRVDHDADPKALKDTSGQAMKMESKDGERKAAILELLGQSAEPLTASKIARDTGEGREPVARCLATLVEEEKVTKSKEGAYEKYCLVSGT